ncbi:MAG: hypothetical protein ACTH6F_14645, partial [Halomonas sp.]
MFMCPHRFYYRQLALSIALAGGSVTVAYAQPSPDDAQQLTTVTVTAQQAATKVETPFIETPQSVSTITQQQM